MRTSPSASPVAASSQDHPRTAKRLDIQGLRALAVIAVVVDHVYGAPVGGFLGVDVFFVISGYLITSLLIREYARSGRISLVDFYRRRVKRILPAAALVVASTLVAAQFAFAPSRFASVVTDALWSGAFLSNWHFAAIGTDYFGSSTAESPLQHFWSLSVEEQFYVVWPLLIIAVIAVLGTGRLRALRGALAITIAIIVAASFVWALSSTEAAPTASYFSTFSRSWELGIGVLVAVGEPLWRRFSQRLRTPLAWIGFVGILASFAFIEESAGVPAPWSLAPVLATALVIIAGCGEGGSRLLPLSNPVTSYLGGISYSLYLWHFPIIVLVAGGTAAASVPLGVLIILASTALAAATFHLVESPVIAMPALTRMKGDQRMVAWRAWRDDVARTLRGWGIGTLAGLTAVVTVAAVAGSQTPPPSVAGDLAAITAPTTVPTASPATAVGALAQEITAALKASTWPATTPSLSDSIGSKRSSDEVAACGTPTGYEAERCTFGDADADKTVAVIGDSMAVTYMEAFESIAALPGTTWKVESHGVFGCPFVDIDFAKGASDRDACSAARKATIADINETKPDVVVVANTYLPVTAVGASAPVTAAEWSTGLSALVSQFSDSAGEVILLAAPPADKDIEQCYTPRSTPASCAFAVPRSWTDRFAAESSVAERLGLGLVDSRPLVCASGYCPAFVGTTPVRADLNHLTLDYSRKIGPALGELLAGTKHFVPSS